ncbi:MAG: polysaccharide deacetylase family protein, partial [Clostridia bacterium]|nr:polysaccharide deacetylase family protein [Clostridia bacterium]
MKYNWYCRHVAPGEIPECPPEMGFIEKENGYYIDRGAEKDPDHPVIYLTFDAGYENGNVEKILDVMREENVHGSFFILKNLCE